MKNPRGFPGRSAQVRKWEKDAVAQSAARLARLEPRPPYSPSAIEKCISHEADGYVAKPAYAVNMI
jgi:hypothetical protein